MRARLPHVDLRSSPPWSTWHVRVRLLWLVSGGSGLGKIVLNAGRVQPRCDRAGLSTSHPLGAVAPLGC